MSLKTYTEVEIANLQGATLQDADLQGADLQDADLQGADLQGATLQDADLQGADLQGADLRRANLQGAKLRGADLECADLRGADLECADLRGADLRRADLECADLRGANLRRANLQGANLQGANLEVGIVVAWSSHTLLSVILRRAAGVDVEKLKVAGLVGMMTDWCWPEFQALSSDPLFGWALDELAGWVRDGDDAPAIIKRRVKTTNTESKKEVSDGITRTDVRSGTDQPS